jgi:hypothetical protein
MSKGKLSVDLRIQRGCSGRREKIDVAFGIGIDIDMKQIRYPLLEGWTYWTFDCGK